MRIDPNDIADRIIDDFTEKPEIGEDGNNVIDPELLDMVQEYLDGGNYADDFAVLVLEYTNPGDAILLDDDVDVLYLCDMVAQSIVKKIADMGFVEDGTEK